jgi:hypothetical protein
MHPNTSSTALDSRSLCSAHLPCIHPHVAAPAAAAAVCPQVDAQGTKVQTQTGNRGTNTQVRPTQQLPLCCCIS